MPDVTTMKISTQTRDRIRDLARPRESLEDVVVAALDHYEHQQFWSNAEAAVANDTASKRRQRAEVERDIDAWMAELQ